MCSKGKVKYSRAQQVPWDHQHGSLQNLLLSADQLASKEAAVQAIKSLFRSVEVSESDVNLASRVLFDVDTLHRPVLGLAFVFDILSEVFVPVGLGFSAKGRS